MPKRNEDIEKRSTNDIRADKGKAANLPFSGNDNPSQSLEQQQE